LTFSVAANAVYTFDGMLHWYTTDETNADMTLGLTSPSGASGNWLGFAQPVSGTTADGIVRTMSTVIANTRTYGADSDTNNPSGLMLRGLLITSSAGTFAANFARTGASGTITLLTNSYITLTRVG
ncbi:MAG TPA: hypothetical protein VNC22_21530, partial [Sporichthya sp.]|nr:hypothetical protein [Sporichthya sp.]